MLEKLLEQNEGLVDRVVRVALGLALLAMVFVGPRTPWGWVGAILLATGLKGTCPLYSLLHLRTCPAPGQPDA